VTKHGIFVEQQAILGVLFLLQSNHELKILIGWIIKVRHNNLKIFYKLKDGKISMSKIENIPNLKVMPT
jgi:hypothetical protein